MNSKRKWKIVTDLNKINKIFNDFFSQADDPSLSIRDRKIIILYPEKRVETTPLKLIKNKIIFYTDEKIGKGKNSLSFFIKQKRLYISFETEIFSIENNRYYFLFPKQIRYFNANELYFISQGMRKLFPVSLTEDYSKSSSEDLLGFLVDISSQGIRIYLEDSSISVGDIIPYISIGMLSYITLGIKDAEVKERKGYFALLLFNSESVSFHVSAKNYLDEKKKKRLKNYQENFHFEHFLDNYFVPELRQLESKFIAKSKEQAEQQEERIEFYFDKKMNRDKDHEEFVIKEIAVIDLPINPEMAMKLKNCKNITVHHYSNQFPDGDVMKSVTLICVDFRILIKRVSFFQPYDYKTILLYDTTQAAQMPKIMKIHPFIGSFSYSQAKIYNEDQIIQAFISLIKPK